MTGWLTRGDGDEEKVNFMVLVIPYCALISIRMQASGQDVVNVIGVNHAQYGSSLSAILLTVKTAWEASGGPLSKHTSALSMIAYHGMMLDSADGEVGELTSTAVGGVGSQALATMASCALLTYGAPVRARSQHGRMYHGPLVETEINTDGRTIATATKTGLESAYNQFRTTLATNNLPWVILSRKNSSNALVGTVACQSTIATQRRRLR